MYLRVFCNFPLVVHVVWLAFSFNRIKGEISINSKALKKRTMIDKYSFIII